MTCHAASAVTQIADQVDARGEPWSGCQQQMSLQASSRACDVLMRSIEAFWTKLMPRFA
jgi:hypothetical protein